MADSLNPVALQRFQSPASLRASGHLCALATSELVLWLTAWWFRESAYGISVFLAVPAGVLMVGLFNVLHDAAHRSFVSNRSLNDWIGRVIGVLTLTPFDDWRRAHMQHHGRAGNLSRRGVQDVDTFTVREFLKLPIWRRAAYRIYRNPLVLVLVGGPYLFLLRYRLPHRGMRADRRAWMSTQGTNLALMLAAILIEWTIGLGEFARVHGPIFLVSTWVGVWLYYIQHQFERTYWEQAESWSRERAALVGSSYLELPGWLRWMTGNSGIHHLHHLDPRIPSYRLWEALLALPDLAQASRLSLRDALRATRLALWDEERRRLVPFRTVDESRFP